MRYLLYKTEYGDYVCASELTVGIASPGDTGWTRYPHATQGDLRHVATGCFVALDHEPTPTEVSAFLKDAATRLEPNQAVPHEEGE